jgi:hypothetical protein
VEKVSEPGILVPRNVFGLYLFAEIFGGLIVKEMLLGLNFHKLTKTFGT